MDRENQVVVIDNGSGVCKVGYAGDELPKAVFPSIVGKPRLNQHIFSSTKSVFIGDEALKRKGILNIKYPIEHGTITNWDDMELIWHHCFSNELRISPDSHPVILTEAPLNPKSNKEKMCSFFFETFQVPAIYIGIQAVLSLYSLALTSGLVLDIGDGVSHIVPTYEGYALSHSIQRLNLAGRDITKYLGTLLYTSGNRLVSSSDFEICRDIKEKVCYVATDYNEELSKSSHEIMMNYQLPDGSFVSVGQERFKAPEIMFNPSLAGLDIDGVHISACKSIGQCDIDIRRSLFENIVLSGGSTMFSNFSDRMVREVKEKSATGVKVKVLAPKERKFSVWIGGSILGALDSFRVLMLTRDEYYEHGVSAVHRKFF